MDDHLGGTKGSDGTQWIDSLASASHTHLRALGRREWVWLLWRVVPAFLQQYLLTWPSVPPSAINIDFGALRAELLTSNQAKSQVMNQRHWMIDWLYKRWALRTWSRGAVPSS